MLGRCVLFLRMLPALVRLASYKPGARTSVGERIEALAARHPERPFVVFEDRRMTYGELNRAANRVAHWAGAAGLRRGSVAALLMENRPEFLATWAGLAKLGVTAALLNTNLTGRALRHALAAARADHLVLGSECVERFATAAGELERPLQVWVDRDPAEGAGAAPPAGARDLGAALAATAETNPESSVREDLRAGDDLFYIYTSGTTGLPKAARFSHLRFLATGELTAWAIGLGPSDVHYCALPLYHTAGGVMVVGSVLAAGATLALRRRFSASRFWDDVRRFGATRFQYIGEVCRYLMQQPPRSDDRDHAVRVIVGNGLRVDLWEPFQRRFGIERVVEFYGATEGNAPIINLENKVGSVGRYPFAWMSNARLIRFDVETETHPRDAGGLCIPCAPGEVGELVGRIPDRADSARGRFEGYTSEEDTRRKILRDVLAKGDAWFRSGDLLRQDEEGFFYFVDRVGDTFRWKGENVSTEEVAAALTGLPGLHMATVYGVRVEGAEGRAGMAALLLEDGAPFDPAAFHRHVSERLPSYAAPLFVRILADVELTGTFKLRKVRLQEEGYDPERVADPLFVRDDAAQRFVPLTRELLDEIRSGARAL
jgi:fatty-acyl-CoA synthase